MKNTWIVRFMIIIPIILGFVIKINKTQLFDWTMFFLSLIICIIIGIIIMIKTDGDSVSGIFKEYNEKQKEEQERIAQENANNIPKCPTCGSTNIRRISGTEKAVNTAAFGLYGNKRKCQFECQNPNCRYRW